jgi:hypothetical protein
LGSFKDLSIHRDRQWVATLFILRYDYEMLTVLMTVEEAKGVCNDRGKWKEVISAYPKGEYKLQHLLVTEQRAAL